MAGPIPGRRGGGGGGGVLISGSLWYDPFVVGKRFGSSFYDLYYSICFYI